MFCRPLLLSTNATIWKRCPLNIAGQLSPDRINPQMVNTAMSNSGGVPAIRYSTALVVQCYSTNLIQCNWADFVKYL